MSIICYIKDSLQHSINKQIMFSSVLLYLLIGIFISHAQQLAGDVSSPQVPAFTHRGMIIDAGSGGSRLHIYAWEPRIFKTLPPPISFPTDEEHLTGKIKPGISSFSNHPEKVRDQLASLIRFAKSALRQYTEQWKYFPIYVKATGGMRELPLLRREAIMNNVRNYLSNKTHCPFYFRDEFARVISGEEEAVYAWSATNFLMGRLLPPLRGIGDAEPLNSTYGTVDMGGSSCQIAFYVPTQDISEGLFKLHIGNQKHWNLYAKSYLSYGHVSARRRHLKHVADGAYWDSSAAIVPRALDYCFHAGYSENIMNSMGTAQVEVEGPAVPASDQLYRCIAALGPLLRQTGPDEEFCAKTYDGECGIGGAYQPTLPFLSDSGFIGISSYEYAWAFLKMPSTATLDEFRSRAEEICAMSFSDVLLYFEGMNNFNNDLADYLPYYCFLSSYTLTLLIDGFGFQHNQTLTVMDSIHGHAVAWPLGAMLFEINELPWELHRQPATYNLWASLVSGIIGLVLGVIMVLSISKTIAATEKELLKSADSSNSLEMCSPIRSSASGATNNSQGTPHHQWASKIMQFNPFRRSGYDHISNAAPPFVINDT